MSQIELKIKKRFYFTGTIFDSGDIYLDVNCDGFDQEYYEEITKEKAKEIIDFLTKFVEGE